MPKIKPPKGIGSEIFDFFASVKLALILLISLALSKAALVAMFFMHLRIEHRTLSLIAVTPLVLGALLVFLLSMDISFVPLHTADAVRTTAAGH